MDGTFYETFSLEAMAADQKEAEAFANRLEETGLYRAPANLKSSILQQSRQLDVRLIAGTNHLSKKTQLFRYSLKVSLAAACSIGFIIAMPRLHERYTVSLSASSSSPIHVEAYEKLQKWNGKISELSKSFFDLEVPLYDE